MIFWIITALLTAVASIAVMYPFLRKQKAAADSEHDLAVYRDQLSELENEVKRGLISKEDAAEARAEIGRRILKLTTSADAANEGQRLGSSGRLIAAAGILAIPLISWGLYSYLGSPGVPAMPLAQRLESDPARASVEELIGRAETHLASNPQDVKGWETLAPVYMRLGRFQDAARAFSQLIALQGPSADTQAMLGEALVGTTGGIVTADAVAVFEKALALDAKEPRARFFIGLARAQEGKLADARTVWNEMVADLPASSPWHSVAQEALSGSAGNDQAAAGSTESAAAEPVPDNADGQMEMIEGMVAGLDARLRDNPNDPEGWQRLIRSYIVLQRKDAAQDALQRGVSALGNDSTAGKELAAFANELGISLPEDEL
jgi:cytochrome c-type biogenesis protein CcmH